MTGETWFVCTRNEGTFVIFLATFHWGEAAFSKVAERNKKVQERLDKVLGVWNSGVSTPLEAGSVAQLRLERKVCVSVPWERRLARGKLQRKTRVVLKRV